MKIQILQDKYLNQVKDDELLLAKIANATGRKISSIKRWIANNDELLTTATVLTVIREHLNIVETESLTEEKEAQPA
jgi:hypothetical protein